MTTWPFIHEDFLLRSEESQGLYHQYAKLEPILDFHNHLSPLMVAENYQFSDIAEMWLAGDHYKWRVMRANGVPERLITGDASGLEKFHAWADIVPHTLGNPLYHWTHLELAREFGIFKLLDGHSADVIWASTKEKMSELKVHDILIKNRVKALCTTDDPVDSLEHHLAVNKSCLGFQMFPTFRPDRALEIHEPNRFRAWIELLETAAKVTIHTLDDLLGALKSRHDFFHEVGCRISDHGLERAWFSPECSHAEADRVLRTGLSGKVCDERDRSLYCSYMMLEFGRWDAARGWTKQLHLGAIRNTNSRLRRLFGSRHRGRFNR